MNTVTIAASLLRPGIALYTPVRESSGQITDFEWVYGSCLNSEATVCADFSGRRLQRDSEEQLPADLIFQLADIVQSGKPFKTSLTLFEDKIVKEVELTAVPWKEGVMVSVSEPPEITMNPSSESYRLLVENSADVICRIDRDGNYEYVSPACSRILGYSPEELKGRNFLEFIHPDECNSLSEVYIQYLNSPEPVTCVNRVKIKSGEYRWIECISVPVLEADINVTGTLATISSNLLPSDFEASGPNQA